MKREGQNNIVFLVCTATLLLTAGCSGGGLSGGSGSSGGKKETSQSNRSSPGKDVELDADEQESLASNPAQVSGSFLVCGDDESSSDQTYGCAVVDPVTSSRLACESFDDVLVTYLGSSGPVAVVTSKPAVGSFWHFTFAKASNLEVTDLAASAQCMGQKHNIRANVFDFAPEISNQDPAPMVIYVTNTTYQGDLNIPFGNDEKCVRESPSILGSVKALLSMVGIPARDVIGASDRGRRIQNTKGELLAQSWDDLWKHGIKAAILNRDEMPLQDQNAQVWTGSDAEGSFQEGELVWNWGDCYGWTAAGFSPAVGWTGSPKAINSSNWFTSASSTNCSQSAHLYCLVVP